MHDETPFSTTLYRNFQTNQLNQRPGIRIQTRRFARERRKVACDSRAQMSSVTCAELST